MAVERWIFSNTNLKDQDLEEFQIRLADGALRDPDCKDRMIELSNRLLAVTKRRGGLTAQCCWFAGYLTPELYVTALAGEQNRLLHTERTESRGLFCTLALAFTGADIRLYKKDEGLFAPLKQLLETINKTGKCPEDGLSGAALAAACRDCADTLLDRSIRQETENIVRSTPETDEALWRQSLTRPVMTGVLSAESAQRFLNDYPDGLVSVAGKEPLRCAPQGEAAEQWKAEFEEEKAQEAEQERQTKAFRAEAERIKRQREADRIQFEREREQAARRRRLWMIMGAICVAGAMVFLFLGGRG